MESFDGLRDCNATLNVKCTVWINVGGGDIQLYLLIEHGAIWRLECVSYKTDIQKSIERARAH